MSDEIPEDVMKAAMKLAADYFPPQRRDRSKLAWSVAVAILAEREAAAGNGPNQPPRLAHPPTQGRKYDG